MRAGPDVLQRSPAAGAPERRPSLRAALALALVCGGAGCLDLEALRSRARDEAPDAAMDGGARDVDADPDRDDPGGPTDDAGDAGGAADASDGSTTEPEPDGGPDGHDSGGPADDAGEPNAPPEIELFFPPPSLTDVDRITVRGRVSDPDGDEIVELSVAGVEGEVADDGSFAVLAPLALGDNVLRARAEDSRGAKGSAVTGVVERHDRFLHAASQLVVEGAGTHALALDASDLAIVRVSLADGGREVIGADGPPEPLGTYGAGSVTSATDLVLDEASGRAYVSDSALGQILALPLDGGSRTVISGPGVGAGPAFEPNAIALDAARGRLIAFEYGDIDMGEQSQVLAVDLATGDRSVLDGGGPMVISAVAAVTDVAGDRVLVFDGSTVQYFAVDLATGARTVLSSSTVGAGPTPDTVADLWLDAPNGRVLVLSEGGEILALELSSGDRTLLANVRLGDDVSADAADSFAAIAGDPVGGALVLTGDGELLRATFEAGDREPHSTGLYGVGPALKATDVCFDTTHERLLVSSAPWPTGEVVAVDLDSGDRTILSNDVTGTGPALDSPRSIAHDYGDDRILVLDSGALIAVDPATGNRTSITDFNDAMPVVPYPRTQLAFDGARGRAIVSAPDQLVAVDLASGERSVLSSASVGMGPMFELTGVAYDSTHDDVFAVAETALLAVDPVTGDRSVISGAGVGSGPDFVSLTGARLDPLAHAVLVVDDGAAALVRVWLADGRREVISSMDVGEGPLSYQLSQLAVDASRGNAYLRDGDGITRVELVARDRSAVSLERRGEVRPSNFMAWALDLDLPMGIARVVGPAIEGTAPWADIDLATGDAVERASGAPGEPPIVFPFSLARGPNPDQYFVYSNFLFTSDPAVFEVDLATPTRRVVVNATTGSGPATSGVYQLAWDAGRERLLATTYALQGVLEIDPTTGASSVVSGGTTGSGPAFTGPRMTCMDTPADRLLITDGAWSSAASLFAVDPVAGERELLSDGALHAELPLKKTFGLVCDPDADRVVAFDVEAGYVAIDLTDGARSVIRPLPAFFRSNQIALPVALGYDARSQVIYQAAGMLFALDTVSGEIVVVSGTAP